MTAGPTGTGERPHGGEGGAPPRTPPSQVSPSQVSPSQPSAGLAGAVTMTLGAIRGSSPQPPPQQPHRAAAAAAAANGQSTAAGAANEPPDDVLVQRLRHGETAAGEVLVRRYFQPLMRYLQRLSGNDHVAEELHQQTWLSVLDHLEKFDPRVIGATGAGGGGSGSSAFKAWLFRIATNKANDLWRSRGRERSAAEGLRLVVEQEAPWAGERLQGKEQEQKLLRAIEQLPENQRQVLLLRYYSDLKFVEIADMLGCPLNTALGRMHKAMMKLKQMMEECGIESFERSDH